MVVWAEPSWRHKVASVHWPDRWPLLGRALVGGLLVANVACGGGGGGELAGSGRTTTERRPMTNFTAIDLRGVGRVTVTLGNQEGLIVEAEDNLLPQISTTVSNGTLVLELKNARPTRPVVYQVSARQIRALSASGSGEIESPGVSGDALQTNQSGSSTFRLPRLSVQELQSTMAGSSALEANGTAARLRLKADGSGKLSGRDLQVRDADLDFSGSGNAVLRVSETLKVRISGAGSVEYLGNPRVDQQITGAGTVRRVE